MNQFFKSNKLWLLLKPVLSYLGIVALLWLAFFEFFRFLFLLINWGKTAGLPAGDVASSFLYGLRFDASITGYLLMLFAVVVTLGLFLVRIYRNREVDWLLLFVAVMMVLLAANHWEIAQSHPIAG